MINTPFQRRSLFSSKYPCSILKSKLLELIFFEDSKISDNFQRYSNGDHEF